MSKKELIVAGGVRFINLKVHCKILDPCNCTVARNGYLRAFGFGQVAYHRYLTDSISISRIFTQAGIVTGKQIGRAHV